MQIEYDIFLIELAFVTGGIFVIFILVIEQIDIRKKVKKLFKNVKMPSDNSQGYYDQG